MSVFKTLLVILSFSAFSESLLCKNKDNESVDWFYLYKLPKEHNSNFLINNGLAYLYMTSDDYQTGWKISVISINDSKSIPGLTLQPFYDKATLMHIFYNDETPSGSKNENLGHTKGVLMFNGTTGFWMIHSVPKFPQVNEYNYPETGVRYGQSFLCISMGLANINNVGKQLLYNEPQIYESYISDKLKSVLGNINAVIQHEKIKNSPWYCLTNLYSLGGQEFSSFAKSGKFGKEIYGDWVAPTLKSDLLVESWLNGAGRLPSDCNHIFQVHNVESIRFQDKLSRTLSFSSSKDHSKWAVTKSKTNKNWICVGDINREEHQKQRGGGTVCILNQELWNEYNSYINSTESCN